MIKRLTKGLTRDEYNKLLYFKSLIMSRMDQNDPNFSELENEVAMGIFRDIQAQRIPPNVKVPSRRKPLQYLKTIHDSAGSWTKAALCYLSPGSWTSSGGTFKLAEDIGFDITKLLLDLEKDKGKAGLIEVGAGYAGFKSKEPKGIKKLVREAGDKLGHTIHASFTNLTNWHNYLPEGVNEYPGFLAREIKLLGEPVDIVYSQCAAYFEPRVREFIEGAAGLLRNEGLLIFNARPERKDEIAEEAEKNGLECKKKVALGEENGDLYVFEKK